MVEISKADWKLFRERIGNWQERYMEKLSKEYVKLLTSPGNASDHFWELEKRIKQDKKHPGVLIEMNQVEMILTLFWMLDDQMNLQMGIFQEQSMWQMNQSEQNLLQSWQIRTS